MRGFFHLLHFCFPPPLAATACLYTEQTAVVTKNTPHPPSVSVLEPFRIVSDFFEQDVVAAA